MDNEERDEAPGDDFPGINESHALQQSWYVVELLRELKAQDSQNGRLWAIALTDAEKLHAWISYVVATVDEG